MSDWITERTLRVREAEAPRQWRPDRVTSRWERLADPEGTMTRDARRRKADRMMRRHMAKMRKARQPESGRD